MMPESASGCLLAVATVPIIRHPVAVGHRGQEEREGEREGGGGGGGVEEVEGAIL